MCKNNLFDYCLSADGLEGGGESGRGIERGRGSRVEEGGGEEEAAALSSSTLQHTEGKVLQP